MVSHRRRTSDVGRRTNASLRIIAGRWKGRKIQAPPGLSTRPLTDRIKQSLCDWMGQDFTALRVADVCAGSGSFAFEAASRGAQEVHAIEAGEPAWTTLGANARSLGDDPVVHLHHARFQDALPRLSDLDLIFCDPPFPWFAEEPETLVDLLAAVRGSLAPTGRCYLRGEQGGILPPPTGLRLVERRDYGRSWVVLLRPA